VPWRSPSWGKLCGHLSNVGTLHHGVSKRIGSSADLKQRLDPARDFLSFSPFRIIATFLLKTGTKSSSRIWRVSSFENSLQDVDRGIRQLGSIGSHCKFYICCRLTLPFHCLSFPVFVVTTVILQNAAFIWNPGAYAPHVCQEAPAAWSHSHVPIPHEGEGW
jgi:hypothetical protein